MSSFLVQTQGKGANIEISPSMKDWRVRTDATICSFLQIPCFTPKQYELAVYGYCRVHYLDKYYDIHNYSFPVNILQLIMDHLIVEYSDRNRTRFPIDYHRMPLRLQKEIRRLPKGSPPGIAFMIHPHNYRYFLIEMQGPLSTPYEGGIFHIELFLPLQYPMKPLKVRFLTPIICPNVGSLGDICLDVLRDKWTPALSIVRLALSIQLLMQDPNPYDPLDGCGSEWIMNRRREFHASTGITLEQYNEYAKQMTEKYAMDVAVVR
eukprot:161156_1